MTYFCAQYARTLNFTPEESDLLYEQFVDYRTLEDIDIAEAKLEEHGNEHRMGTIWFILWNMKSHLQVY